MPLTVEIVTIERIVRTEENVDVLLAPGSEGQLAILPRHAALMTTLDFGELTFRRGSTESHFAIAGGFIPWGRGLHPGRCGDPCARHQ